METQTGEREAELCQAEDVMARVAVAMFISGLHGLVLAEERNDTPKAVVIGTIIWSC